MKLTFPLLNTTITVPVDDTMTNGKTTRRSLRKKAEHKITERIEKTEKISEAGSTEIKPPTDSFKKSAEKPLDSSNLQSGSQSVLMVEVVNITHEKFKQTEEIKVTYKMILKIRNIATLKIIIFIFLSQ